MQRLLAGQQVNAMGLGCMNLSHAYGQPPSEDDGAKVLLAALEAGVTHFDTAALYGFGKNETLLGKVLKSHRDKFFLASKCGMTGVDGKRVIDGRPDTIKQTIEEGLSRLQTEVIDLYYLHRWDKNVPVEDSVGALADLVKAGKIKAIGLSEVSADTLRKAHAVHPIAAVQTEYSLWTRNAEIAMLDTCKELGAAFVAFSPLARGFLGGKMQANMDWVKGDIRAGMPRFQPDALAHNLSLLPPLQAIADELGCTLAQLSLAWVLAQGEHVHAIPGTTSVKHLQDNMQAANIVLSAEQVAKINAAFDDKQVQGPRYPAPTQAEIDTEEFA